MNATAYTHALAYCFALRVMSKEPTGGFIFQRQIHSGNREPEPARRTLLYELKKSLYLPANDPSHFSAHSPEVLMKKRIQALVTVGIFSVTLRRYIEVLCYRALENGRDFSPMSIPTSNSVPLHSIMDIPIPFSNSAAMDLASCHTAKMTTAAFLEDGEWAGYYSTSHASGGYQHFHPPLHGIRIVATAGSDSASTLSLHGIGN